MCDAQQLSSIADAAAAALAKTSGYAVSERGNLTFAPIGEISNPAGTYGSVLLPSLDGSFALGDSDNDNEDFCQCIKGDTTVDDST